MYAASAPVFQHLLGGLKEVLSKGAAHVAANDKLDEPYFVQGRLYPDMFTLARQVEVATEMAKSCLGRLAGVEWPAYTHTDLSFADLGARVEQTLAFIDTLTPEQINGTEDKRIQYTILEIHERDYLGLPYLVHVTLPQVTFHVTTAYAILRSLGVAIGKKDFNGTFAVR